jgi:hypothetical protein
VPPKFRSSRVKSFFCCADMGETMMSNVKRKIETTLMIIVTFSRTNI